MLLVNVCKDSKGDMFMANDNKIEVNGISVASSEQLGERKGKLATLKDKIKVAGIVASFALIAGGTYYVADELLNKEETATVDEVDDTKVDEKDAAIEELTNTASTTPVEEVEEVKESVSENDVYTFDENILPDELKDVKPVTNKEYEEITEKADKEAEERNQGLTADVIEEKITNGETVEYGGTKISEESYKSESGQTVISESTTTQEGEQIGVKEESSNQEVTPNQPAPAPAPTPEPTPAPAPAPENNDPQVGDSTITTNPDGSVTEEEVIGVDEVLPDLGGGVPVIEPAPTPAPENPQVSAPVDTNGFAANWAVGGLSDTMDDVNSMFNMNPANEDNSPTVDLTKVFR